MFKRTTTPTRIPDRLSYLWLAIAAALFLFYDWPVGYPVGRLARASVSAAFCPHPAPASWTPAGLARQVCCRCRCPLRGSSCFPALATTRLFCSLPGCRCCPTWPTASLHPGCRALSRRWSFHWPLRRLSTSALLAPLGPFNSIANTQYGDLPLLQVVSVTGIWGLTFLITWFAAVVNWAWEQHFAWPQVRGGALLYAAILAVVLLGGGARLALFPPQATPVRVAGLSASQAAVAAFNQQLPQATLSLLLSGKATQADRALARSAFTTLDDDLLARSQQEARAGAKIVVWPEASPVGANILQEDEPALIQRAGALAQQAGHLPGHGAGRVPARCGQRALSEG